MEIGKLAGDRLKKTVLNKIEHFRSDVLVPAGPGEDSAVIDLGDYLLVVSSDPITGAEKNAGYLAVNVACNDIAAAGAEPFGIQVVLFLPPSLGEQRAEKMMEEIVCTARSMEIEVLGGHTEITDLVQKPIITVTALGRADKKELASSSAAEAGDILYISKGMGIEGSYILGSDYEEHLIKKGVSSETLTQLKSYINLLSVIPESQIARKNGVKAMHDVTEGGVYGAISEMAAASKLGFVIEKDNFRFKPEVEEVCSKLSLNPAALISSGSMLMAAAPDNDLKSVFAENDIDIIRVGRMIEKGTYIEEAGKKKEFRKPEKDELWKFIEKYHK
ncbi:MAG: AIR synthase family protein [Halanaerobium sp.]